MAALGASVMGSAGFAWSGDIDRLGGGETGCCIGFFVLTPEPNPGRKREREQRQKNLNIFLECRSKQRNEN